MGLEATEVVTCPFESETFKVSCSKKNVRQDLKLPFLKVWRPKVAISIAGMIVQRKWQASKTRTLRQRSKAI